MSRKQPKRRAGSVALKAMAGIFIVAVIGGIGLGVASADSADELATQGAFGLDSATTAATISPKQIYQTVSESSFREQSLLSVPTSRDISGGLALIEEKERIEAERAAAEQAAALERMAAMQAAQSAEASAQEIILPEVDWTVGKEAFIAEWTARIDAYLAGSPLEGYGYAFAEAAWDNGVDPRFSPAISNTESTKGANCFRAHNAWGWGSISWSDWDTAIRAHVAGLAEGYGYSITMSGAYKYCPGTHVDWYHKTVNQMLLI